MAVIYLEDGTPVTDTNRFPVDIGGAQVTIMGDVVAEDVATETTLDAIKELLSRDLRGKFASRPGAASVDAGTTYWSVDKIGNPTDEHAVSDGSSWVAYTP